MQQRSFPEKPIGFSRGSVTLDIMLWSTHRMLYHTCTRIKGH